MEFYCVGFDTDCAEAAFKWRSQPAAFRHNPFMPLSIEQVLKEWAKASTDLSALGSGKQEFRWFVKREGTCVATMAIKNINLTMGFGEISYMVDDRFHGQGMGTFLVGAFVERLFLITDLRKIIAFVHDQNVASCCLLENIGFTKEGLLREHYILHGEPVNECLYGLLKIDPRPSPKNAAQEWCVFWQSEPS